MHAHLLGETKELRQSPVRIYVMEADEWRDLETWPPSNMQARRWYLQPETATTMNIAGQSIYHDPQHPSAVILPMAEDW